MSRLVLLLLFSGSMATGLCAETVVGFNYSAVVATNSAADDVVFGRSIPLQTVVEGYFTYRTNVADANSDPQRGDYQQIESNFLAEFDPGSVDLSISGSNRAFVQVENLAPAETLRFLDGDQTFRDTGVMAVDGIDSPDASLFFAVSGATDFLVDDSLMFSPAAFISQPNGPSDFLAHTFALQDGTSTLLLQFTSVTAIPEVSGFTGCMLIGCGLLFRRRRPGQGCGDDLDSP